MAAQIPNIGLYLVTIDPNNLKTFLSAMYKSSFVVDAFPNGVVVGSVAPSGSEATSESEAIKAMPRRLEAIKPSTSSSLIQSLSVKADFKCGTMADAEAAFAGQCISVNNNDITIALKGVTSEKTAFYIVIQKIVSLLVNAQKSNLPVIINDPFLFGDSLQTYLACYSYITELLQNVYLKNPDTLKNALIIQTCAFDPIDETSLFKTLQTLYPHSGIWNSLYFVESQEGKKGNGSNCLIGYASVGTPNVFSAPGCDIRIPDHNCVAYGTSLSTATIANLIARTFMASNQSVPLSTIAKALWNYQANNNWALPSALKLLGLSGYTGTPPDGCNLSCGTHQTTTDCMCFTSTTLAANGIAYGISDKGTIVGAAGWDTQGYLKTGIFNNNNTGFSPYNVAGVIGVGFTSATELHGINDTKPSPNSTYNYTIVGVYADSKIVLHGFYGATPYDFPGAYSTVVSAINNSGTIAGYYVIANSGLYGFYDGKSYAFPGARATYITSINNSDTIAGYYTDSNEYYHGFYDGKSYDFPGAIATHIMGINDSNTIAGWYYTKPDAVDVYHGFYDGLSYDFPGAYSTTINGINNKNTFVGQYWTDTAGVRTSFAYVTTVAR